MIKKTLYLFLYLCLYIAIVSGLYFLIGYSRKSAFEELEVFPFIMAMLLAPLGLLKIRIMLMKLLERK